MRERLVIVKRKGHRVVVVGINFIVETKNKEEEEEDIIDNNDDVCCCRERFRYIIII